MSQQNIYRARADEARDEANQAPLDRVKERALRSAAAWDAMADREERVSVARERREAEKAAIITEAATVSDAGVEPASDEPDKL